MNLEKGSSLFIQKTFLYYAKELCGQDIVFISEAFINLVYLIPFSSKAFA